MGGTGHGQLSSGVAGSAARAGHAGRLRRGLRLCRGRFCGCWSSDRTRRRGLALCSSPGATVGGRPGRAAGWRATVSKTARALSSRGCSLTLESHAAGTAGSCPRRQHTLRRAGNAGRAWAASGPRGCGAQGCWVHGAGWPRGCGDRDSGEVHGRDTARVGVVWSRGWREGTWNWPGVGVPWNTGSSCPVGNRKDTAH